jgi:very-short-patch-repair endonuclease
LLWEVLPSQRAAVDVTVEGRKQRRPGIDVHETRLIHPDDRAVIAGIPVTSLQRTLLDLAEVERPHRLERALEESVRLSKLDGRKLGELLNRSHGRRGLKPLRAALIAAVEEQPAMKRSDNERALARICRQHNLPKPQHNATVEGFEVDAYWPSHRLVVEIDSFEFHKSRAAFERDRTRDVALTRAGYTVIRFTDTQIQREPDYVAAVLAQLFRG